VAIDGVSSTVPWFVVTVNVCAPAAVPKDVYKASKATPLSLMPAIDTAYFSPVRIIEVTFVNPVVENGCEPGAATSPEQLTLIVFIALTDEKLSPKDDPPGKEVKDVLEFNKLVILVCAELEIVKLFKLKVNTAKLWNPFDTTEAVLNKGIDSRETQLSNIFCIVVTEEVTNKGTDFKEKQSENMLDIFVTELVTNKGTDFKE
jgi:hypothetical protein